MKKASSTTAISGASSSAPTSEAGSCYKNCNFPPSKFGNVSPAALCALQHTPPLALACARCLPPHTPLQALSPLLPCPVPLTNPP